VFIFVQKQSIWDLYFDITEKLTLDIVSAFKSDTERHIKHQFRDISFFFQKNKKLINKNSGKNKFRNELEMEILDMLFSDFFWEGKIGKKVLLYQFLPGQTLYFLY
jgi:hypothetical protein